MCHQLISSFSSCSCILIIVLIDMCEEIELFFFLSFFVFSGKLERVPNPLSYSSAVKRGGGEEMCWSDSPLDLEHLGEGGI